MPLSFRPVTKFTLAVVSVTLLTGAPSDSSAVDLLIEVDTMQRVTVRGRGSSVRGVLEEVCLRADVDLLSYDATDRPYGGTYLEVPIDEFFRRLLRDESYMLETTSASGYPRVAAIRVLGDPAVAAERRRRGDGRPRRGLRLPATLVDAAFAGMDEETDQPTALASLGSYIAGNQAQLQAFLATDSILIAQALRRHKNVEEPLRELKQRYRDPRIVAKIDEVLRNFTELSSAAAP